MLRLLTSPDSLDAEAIFTDCSRGRRKQSVVVPRSSLKMAARNIDGMRSRIADARQSESLSDNRHTMGFCTSTLSFGLGHFEVRGYGPNCTDMHADTELRGRLRVRIWTKSRGYPAMEVTLDEAQAQALANTLWDASQPPGVVAFEWSEAS